MSTFSELAGGFARVRISGIAQPSDAAISSTPRTSPAVTAGPAFYTIQDWSVDDEAESGDTTNTEGGLTPAGLIAKEEIGVAGQCRVMLKQASFDLSCNFFSFPLSTTLFSPGQFLRVELFPAGLIRGLPYLFPLLLVKKRRWEGRAGGLQPVTLECVSSWSWNEAGQISTL